MAEPLERNAIVRVATACALVLSLSGCGESKVSLPSIPDFRNQNQVSVSTFHEAELRARVRPYSHQSIGRLGMLYHAYQFLPQARVCYKTALYLAPREFRWIYYLAKLEKSAFNYEASEALFLLTAQMKPKDAELWAELADLYLMGARKEEAARSSGKALELDPMQPTAILAQARLLSLEGKWNEVIPLLEPLLERYPRLSAAHRYLAGAYGALGDEDKRAFHQVLGEHGTSIESERMRELEELAIPAILEGAPARGAELVESKCTRCHDTRRIQEFDEDRRWWARTIRRMQRQAGWDWLTDDEAAALVAHLARRRS